MKIKKLSFIGYLLGVLSTLLLSVAFFSLNQAGLGAIAVLPWLVFFLLLSLIILFRRSWKNGLLFIIVVFLCPFIYFNCKWQDLAGTKVFFHSFLILLYSFFFWYKKNSFKISVVVLILPMALGAFYIYKQEQNHRLIDDIPFQILRKVHRCLEENAKRQISSSQAKEVCSFDYTVHIPKSACTEMFKDEESRSLGITKYPIHGGARDGWGNKIPQNYDATRYTSVKLNGRKIQLENCQSDNVLTYKLVPNHNDLEYYDRRKQMELEDAMRKAINESSGENEIKIIMYNPKTGKTQNF